MLAKVKAACEAAHKEAGVNAGGKFAAIKLDVSDKSAVADLWKDVPQDLRDVDILGTSYMIPSKAVSNEKYIKSTTLGLYLGSSVSEISSQKISKLCLRRTFWVSFR